MKAFLITLLVVLTTNVFADEQLYIKIGDAKTKKSLLGFPQLNYSGSPAQATKNFSIGAEMYNVIQNDLDVSGYFQFIASSAFLEDGKKTGLKPHPGEANGFKFDNWKPLSADFLIKGEFLVDKDDQIELEIYLYHVPKSGLVFGKKYRGPKSTLRKIAHTFANDVLKNLTDKSGPFNSKFVFSSDRGGGKFREIYTMDWDGVEIEKLTNHNSIALSPAWSPDAKKIAYTAYVQKKSTKMRNADLFLFDLEKSKRTNLSYRTGINSGAAFTPNGSSILLTISQGVTPNIFKINLDGEIQGKITNGPGNALNVEPAVSPDGRKVAFSSDRSGKPMIYVMDIDGSNVTRITFGGVFNSAPAWSPDGKRIAFAGQDAGNFDIFVMDSSGQNITRVTSAKKANGKAADNEDPHFSPDGRFIVYTSNRTGKNQIYFSTVDGSEERRVTQDSHNYYKPKWSTFLD
ncbi:MAG: PD40 domain-containing protein [Bdellovibrionaceae bacterium]|jgi:TolB protein|nr:PD40 domain-containing protein [Pseudobdellovibrionaceae bacterium]